MGLALPIITFPLPGRRAGGWGGGGREEGLKLYGHKLLGLLPPLKPVVKLSFHTGPSSGFNDQKA